MSSRLELYGYKITYNNIILISKVYVANLGHICTTLYLYCINNTHVS